MGCHLPAKAVEVTSSRTTLGLSAHIGLAALSAKSHRYTFERWVQCQVTISE